MLEKIYENLLINIGEDINREGLVKTPERAAKAMSYLVSGYSQDIDEIVNGALFSVDYEDIVSVKNIEFYSMCEHHILPFYGTCSVSYIPNGKVIGLSKIPRIVNMYSRRLQVQERLCKEIATAIYEITNAKAVCVTMEARHMCMLMRGVEKNCDTYTKICVGEVSTEIKNELCKVLE